MKAPALYLTQLAPPTLCEYSRMLNVCCLVRINSVRDARRGAPRSARRRINMRIAKRFAKLARHIRARMGRPVELVTIGAPR